MRTSDPEEQALEAEVVHVESTIDELEREKIDLKRQINACCPVLKVPPEISVKIFMEIFPGDSFSSFSSWGTETPLKFGAVCYSWREIAWSFPLLWSSISFTTRHLSISKNGLLKEWLARSGNLPLLIQLKLEQPSAKEMKEASVRNRICETMDIIARCSERWQHIDFELFVLFHHKLCFVPTQFPLLISMSIRGDTAEFWHKCGINDFPKVFWNAPKLQHVHADIVMAKYMTLPLGKITTYSQFGLSSHNFLSTIQAAPYMTRCKFADKPSKVDYSSSTTPPNITALHLESIEVKCSASYNIDQVDEILNKLTTPALHELSVDMIDSKSAFPYLTFKSLVFRSGCHLMRLSLSHLDLSASEMAEWLSTIPSLSELILKDNIKTIEILKSLNADQPSREILLPNLESFIYVHDSKNSKLDFSSLALMAVSRWDRDARASKMAQLKSIHVEFSETKGKGSDREVDEDAMTKFRELLAKGMNVRILGVTTPIL